MLSALAFGSADNTYRNLDYLGYKKIESNDCFIIHCFEENNDNALRNLERLPFVRKFR